MGGIQLALKKADMKRNRFTMNVMADDRTVEKKDKGVNEPVQFYTSSSRIPYELVVKPGEQGQSHRLPFGAQGEDPRPAVTVQRIFS